MVATNDELEFDHHLKFYERSRLLSGDPKKDAAWHRKAEYLHSLQVCDAVLDACFSAISLSQCVPNTGAQTHLNFGVAARAKFVWISFRNILGLIHPDNNEPLPRADIETAARDLNVVYINIRGALDNFAWCFLELFGNAECQKEASSSPAQVNLFNARFLNQAGLAEVSASMQRFQDWSKELKSRRDPAAHRIPLSIPPSIIDDSTKDEYQRLTEEWIEARKSALQAVADGENRLALFEKARELFDRIERVGTFHPRFAHAPSEGWMKIYPTVPNDIGRFVVISRSLLKLISDKLEGRAALVSLLRQRATQNAGGQPQTD